MTRPCHGVPLFRAHVSDLELWKVVPVETAVARDEFVRLVKRMGRDQKIRDDAVARFRGQLAIFNKNPAGEMQVFPTEGRQTDLHATKGRFRVRGIREVDGGFGSDDRADNQGASPDGGVKHFDSMRRMLGRLAEHVDEDVGVECDGHDQRRWRVERTGLAAR